jgi:hypothetical protein
MHGACLMPPPPFRPLCLFDWDCPMQRLSMTRRTDETRADPGTGLLHLRVPGLRAGAAAPGLSDRAAARRVRLG